MGLSNDNSASKAAPVTPNDSGELGLCKALYVGTQGDVSVLTEMGDTVTFVGAIGILPVRVRRVRATGTTATDIVALY